MTVPSGAPIEHPAEGREGEDLRVYLGVTEWGGVVLVNARDDEHLRAIEEETGLCDEVVRWRLYNGPLLVRFEVTLDLKDGRLQGLGIFADEPLHGHMSSRDIDTRQGRRSLEGLAADAAPDAASVLLGAARRDPSFFGEDDLTPADRQSLLRAFRRDARRRGPRRAEGSLALYWVETGDHDEDWFVVARSPAEAAARHEGAEGYDEGDAMAEFVADVPATAPDREPGWPTDALLRACGGVVERATTPRLVRFGKRLFAEGMLQNKIEVLQDDAAERRGRGRSNGTAETPQA